MKRNNRLPKDKQYDLIFDLINAIALVNDSKKASLLLQDLLSKSEVNKISKRLRIAKLLLENKTYEEIKQDIHCSFGVVAKMSAWLEEAGIGIKDVIKKLPKRQQEVDFGINPRWRQYRVTSLWEDYLNLKAFVHRRKVEELIENTETKKKLFDKIQRAVVEIYKNKRKK